MPYRTLPPLLALLLPLAGELPCQQKRHVMRPSAERELLLEPRSYHQDRFLLKFAEEIRVRPAGASGDTPALRETSGRDLSRIHKLLAGTRIERLFTRPVADLEEENRRIRARLQPGWEPPADLLNYYRVFTTGRETTLELIHALLEEPLVETAFPEFHAGAALPAQGSRALPTSPRKAVAGARRLPGPSFPMVGRGVSLNGSPIGSRRGTGFASQTPLFEPMQFHLFPAPLGLGYIGSLGILGTQGNPRQGIFHVEAAWRLDHEDLPGLRPGSVLGKTDFGSWNTTTWREHGTASVGIFHASRDRKGVRGTVPESTLFVCSAVNGFSNMVSLAMARANAGDIFTTSMVFAVYRNNKGYHTPFDWPQNTYDVVRNAALMGVVFTMPAGNSGVDLANPSIYGNRYFPTSPRSGSFICGATFGPSPVRASWSNYGSAVEANAWGAGVTTTAYGDLHNGDKGRRSYTWQFGGTSAASPQVAGILASVQSVAMMQKGKQLHVSKLREALRKWGTKIQGNIGMRPNLTAMLAGLGLWEGLRGLSEPNPGGMLTLEVRLDPGSVFALFASPELAPRDLGYRFLDHLPPWNSKLFHVGYLPRGPRALVHLGVPKDPELSGRKFYFQAYHLKAGSPVENTNAAEVWIR